MTETLVLEIRDPSPEQKELLSALLSTTTFRGSNLSLRSGLNIFPLVAEDEVWVSITDGRAWVRTHEIYASTVTRAFNKLWQIRDELPHGTVLVKSSIKKYELRRVVHFLLSDKGPLVMTGAKSRRFFIAWLEDLDQNSERNAK
jgi:hypothetical protein